MITEREIVWTLVGLILVGLSNAQPAAAGSLDGLWFSCEFAHRNAPPDDNCQILDDDGFLIKGGDIAYVKVKNGDPAGCKKNRAGQCFDRSRMSLQATTIGIGEVIPTKDGGIVSYFWCDQAYTVTTLPTHAEVRPTGERCLWTSDKTYYVARWQGKIEIDD